MLVKRYLIAVLLSLGFWLSVGTTAWAGTDYEFLRVQKWRATQSPVELGVLHMDIDPLTEGRHGALFTLPPKFEFSNMPTIVTALQGTALLHFTRVADNELLGEVEVLQGNEKSTFLMPIRCTIPNGAAGDVDLLITSVDGQLAGAVITVGATLPGEVAIESSKVARVVDGRAKVQIDFSENMAGLLWPGSPVKLTLPEGFVWTAAQGAVVSGEGLKARPMVDGRVLEVRTDTESTTRAVFRVDAELAAEAEKAMVGEVRAEVTGFRSASPGSVLVAHYVTPKQEPGPGLDDGRTVGFTIGAGAYTINGKPAVMDAVPYVKNGRTFLPLRYVGLSLGVEAEDIEWDGAITTLTKGDTVVKAAAGVKSIEVNGTARVIDAAPEMAPPGRIMLPYRALAEAFGATVDWDAATKTVLMRL